MIGATVIGAVGVIHACTHACTDTSCGEVKEKGNEKVIEPSQWLK
jgi:hypothetical protein